MDDAGITEYPDDYPYPMIRGRDRRTPVGGLLKKAERRSRATLRDRWQRVKATLVIAAQSGLAASLAWVGSATLLDHPQPVFAPISAVITLDISVGQRLRRAVELVVGVALGIGIGDALILWIGTGAWQIGVAVTLAIGISVFLGGSPALVSQAASSAVLVATLVPPSSGIYLDRPIDALIGGLAAIIVMALLLPVNPLTLVSREANATLSILIDGLAATAEAMRNRDSRKAQSALDRMQEGENEIERLKNTLPDVRETVTIAPLRWRTRGALAQYVESADDIAGAMRNSRVAARRAVNVIDDGEPVPEQLPRSFDTLAESVRLLRRDLAANRSPDETIRLIGQAVREAAEAYRAGLGFSGTVVVAQVRTIGTDLLGTAGLAHREANQLVRRAGGNPPPAQSGDLPNEASPAQ
jgi:uncharacterized membrane protein YgaE (UPF0421/DUF939 family)